MTDHINLNADPRELDKFGELAHRWWDPDSEFKPLHDINPLRLDWIDKNTSLAGKRVLDVGCGGGILAESMARRGAQVTGIDLSERPLSVARLHLLDSEEKLILEYRMIAVEALAEEQAASFDVITCMEMLEHVPEPASVVHACAKLVKPGGQIFLSTINRKPKAYLHAVIGAEYILNLLPRGTHDYARFLRPAELARDCRNAGLCVDEIIGMTYNPLNKIYTLNTDTSVNYLLRASSQNHIPA